MSEKNDVHVYSTNDPKIDKVSYHAIPDHRFIPSLALNILILPALLLHTISLQYDVLYTYRGFHFCPCVVSVLTGANWIVDFQTKPTAQGREWSEYWNHHEAIVTAYYMIEDFFYRHTLPAADDVITLSEPIVEHLRTNYGVNRTKSHLVPSGVDVKRFSPTKKQNGSLKLPIDIVYIGTISPSRKLEICIDALASNDMSTDVKFHFVGSGPEEYETRLKKRAEKKGVSHCIVFHGYIDHDSIPEILDNMDVAISPLPKYDSYEVSSPVKLFEYISMGLPILCTDIGAHRRHLLDHPCGLFFNPNSAISLVDRMNELQEYDDESWQSLRRSARNLALENSWDQRMETIDSVIQKQNTSNPP
jgi:glycosyltransferase involved in cell wall biosynthesis